jgi:hypothetical protein
VSDVDIARALIDMGPFCDGLETRKWVSTHPEACQQAADEWWQKMAIPPALMEGRIGTPYWLEQGRE